MTNQAAYLGIALFTLLFSLATAPAATTVTAFITCISFIFLILSNVVFLHEQLTLRQIAGSLTILAGIAVIMG